MKMTIGQVARGSGCPAVTIRYYERSGLLRPPQRGTNGYRYYSQADVERLDFVVRARSLGFPVADIAALLAISDHPDSPCDAVDEKVGRQLDQVRARIEQLSRLAERLEELKAACDGGHPAEDCRILRALADPEASPDQHR